jgi:hypothetical protein
MEAQVQLLEQGDGINQLFLPPGTSRKSKPETNWPGTVFSLINVGIYSAASL